MKAEKFPPYMGKIRRVDRDRHRPISVTLEDIDEQRELGWPDFHPEDYCHRCGNQNVSWFTESANWDYIVGNDDPWQGIICMPCFVELGEAALWHVTWTMDRDSTGTVELVAFLDY